MSAESDASIGTNIQGPSVIRVPAWLPNPLGRYYMYFADHKGKYIRLAYANHIAGPWHVYVPGSLHLRDSTFPVTSQQPQSTSGRDLNVLSLPHSAEYEGSTPHIASPDVHVRDDRQQIVMYFHGLEAWQTQRTRLATSNDGIHFQAQPESLCASYLRVVRDCDRLIAMTMPGVLYQPPSWRGPFENGMPLFNKDFRHHALLIEKTWLHIFWTQVEEAPEHIKVSLIELASLRNGRSIKAIHLGSLLKPELPWEGAHEPNEPSKRSVAYGLKNQLRDPAILANDGQIYLFYAGGGESAIGVVKLHWHSK